MYDAITQVNTQLDENQGLHVRSLKRAQTCRLHARGLMRRTTQAQLLPNFFMTKSDCTPAPLFEAVPADRLYTIGARPRLFGCRDLRQAPRGGECLGELPNGKQDAYRRDPPGRNPGCGREWKPC
jgi:hypothetical protein